MACLCEGSCPCCFVGEVKNHKCSGCKREFCDKCHGIKSGGPHHNTLNCSCPEDVKGKCVVCKGPLIEKVVRKFDATTGPMIIGPGSRNQFRNELEGFHCMNCGLKYEFIPKSK